MEIKFEFMKKLLLFLLVFTATFSLTLTSCSKDKIAKIDCSAPTDIAIQFDILFDNLLDNPSKKTCQAVIDYFQAVVNKCGEVLSDDDLEAFNEAIKDIDCSVFD